jgi:xylulokinase
MTSERQKNARKSKNVQAGRKRLIKMVANPALTGFTAPKILWLRNKEPKHFAKVTQVLLPKDYIRFRLSGVYATEVSDASGTLLMDVAKRQWNNKLLEKLELDAGLLPPVFESQEISSALSSDVAKELGLPAGVPIVGGAADNACSGLGERHREEGSRLCIHGDERRRLRAQR